MAHEEYRECTVCGGQHTLIELNSRVACIRYLRDEIEQLRDMLEADGYTTRGYTAKELRQIAGKMDRLTDELTREGRAR